MLCCIVSCVSICSYSRNIDFFKLEKKQRKEKLMKKLIFIIFIFSMFLLPSVVYASDESIPPEVDQSWLAEFYETEIKPQLATFIVVCLGAVGGISGVISFTFNWVKKKVNKAINNLNINEEEKQRLNELNENILGKVEDLVIKKLEPLIERVDEMCEQNDNFIEENKTLKKQIETMTAEMVEKQDVIVKVLKIALTNDERLVKNGRASAIKKVINNEN